MGGRKLTAFVITASFLLLSDLFGHSISPDVLDCLSSIFIAFAGANGIEWMSTAISDRQAKRIEKNEG